ncbi:hypothetical protein [Photorhabdus sp. RM323S]|uniref:hypothetical protein n=1 Tax=Photorhabdus sp. RM323S TaxID=3342828 RepID=UPI0036DD21D4
MDNYFIFYRSIDDKKSIGKYDYTNRYRRSKLDDIRGKVSLPVSKRKDSFIAVLVK